IRASDIAKTAFRSHRRHYEFLRLPMGCNVSAQLFQKLMNTVLRGLTDRVFVYLDDILIATNTFEEYLETLEAVLQRFQEAGMMLRPDKCEFLKKELLYLGNILNKDGLLPDPGNVQAVREFPVPVNVHQMRRFIGLASYYRKFVPNFASIIRPMTQLLRKDVKYEWTDIHQKAFTRIRELLCTAPVLHHADPDKPYYIEVDGSRYGLGATLNQKDDEGKLFPIAYASQGLNVAESKYGATELEALAVKFALLKFKSFIWGNEVFVRTDHRALTFLAKSQSADSPSKYHRWALIVDAANAKLVYKKGVDNATADALSRS
ncbi:MAG: hypothetical protein GY739_21060, partial [Mesoflavibacter sp.]|nr:hypothetical protein [Mesoflavibacter sp.]